MTHVIDVDPRDKCEPGLKTVRAVSHLHEQLISLLRFGAAIDGRVVDVVFAGALIVH